MQGLFAALCEYQVTQPMACAISGRMNSIRYVDLVPQIQRLASWIQEQRIGIALHNGPAWVITDLALLYKNVLSVPIPSFFSESQVSHLVDDAKIEAVITDQPEPWRVRYPEAGVVSIQIAGEFCYWIRIARRKRVLVLSDTVKVTYTSGTTGEPKGVCLSATTLGKVTRSLCDVTQSGRRDRTFALLPFSILLENIACIYVPLMTGGCCLAYSLEQSGVSRANHFDMEKLLVLLDQTRPTGLVLIPQLLLAMVQACEVGLSVPDSLRFVAVGGAPTSQGLLSRARRYGIPVYQGYGLSEAGSVVCLNTPDHHREGSVGQCLPHVSVRFADDGEILLSGKLFNGYIGGDSMSDTQGYPTGDIGYADAEGFVFLTGRKKSLFVTAYGRNVSPEWIEKELIAQPLIAQAAVFGEARPFNVAIIVAREGAADPDVAASIAQVNQNLPEYARITCNIVAKEPFGMDNGELTATGRLRRSVIASRYKDALEKIYSEVV
jgi:long-chain acyl-CoA synthetase